MLYGNILSKTLLIAVGLLFACPFSHAGDPFRLLTMEAAENPSSKWVAGLQVIGINTGPVLIETNPILDLAYTPNLGIKFVTAVESDFHLTAGARYLKFTGSGAAETKVKEQTSLIERFKIDYQGYTAFLGATYRPAQTGYHFNFQYANISNSKVTTAIFGANVPFAGVWSVLAEGGYDFHNKQPRASLGVSRNGPTFGTRLGLTYVEINDPLLNYKGPLPVIDLYWLFGG